MNTEVSQVVPELCLQCSANTPASVSPDLWCLDNIRISDLPFVDSDDEAIQRFNETVKFDDGRY